MDRGGIGLVGDDRIGMLRRRLCRNSDFVDCYCCLGGGLLMLLMMLVGLG